MLLARRLSPVAKIGFALTSVGVLILGGIMFKNYTTVTPIPPAQMPARNATFPEIEILAAYDTKIVYTTNITAPKQDFIGDCSLRGGVFNSCDFGCEPDARNCPILCAYTCTFPQVNP